ncbi:MAG: 4-(cytidine 5'-diphospho)-2-C-methyl-D-erythritol kinase [Nitriliruptoraceae bacterium]
MGASTPACVRVRVPAKVNLFLRVDGVRPDGYHDLVTVFQTVSLYDLVTAELEVAGSSAHPASRRFMELRFATDAGEDVPRDGDNLAVRAARLLMQRVGIGTESASGQQTRPVTTLHLDKAIPVAAGMAGGSADAAAALVALNQLWQADLGREELRELAATLGSDVPFCITGGTALATGTGTVTAQVLARGTYHWVVGVTARPLSTPAVYRAFDEVGGASCVEFDAVLQALRTADAEALGAALHNDLEVAACHLLPELEAKRDAMLAEGALGAIVSGSGPTLLALATDARHAVRMAAALEPCFDRVEIALSPAAGPEISVS